MAWKSLQGIRDWRPYVVDEPALRFNLASQRISAQVREIERQEALARERARQLGQAFSRPPRLIAH
ncbi:MAG TPA: hypothetical protein VG866_02500 [Candidatus Paceibacterota bacterium]|nr:hypothetical protein [Candidatus Paceibacterota bacterium]